VVLTAAKAAGLSAALVLLADLAIRLGTPLGHPARWPVLAAGLLLGYLGADLASGAVHWICDTFFSEDTPLVGPMVIRPFRDHHRHPARIAEYRLLEQDGTNYLILLLPLYLAASGGGPAVERTGSVLAHAALLGFSVGSLGTNLFHKWAHADRVPPGVRWLQRSGLILSPRRHAVHHRSYTGGYCVTSGWLNPLLDRIDLFGRVERGVRRLLPRRAVGNR
jgi:ubiquitin-conjugating enzyme E2 variant